MAALRLGLRVVRGTDWEGGNQDGGEGYVGTVVQLEEGSGAVVVQWDAGQRCRYRCGELGKYDLRILDTGPTGMKHVGTACGWCSCTDVSGVLWKCAQCLQYYLCSGCYHGGKHSLEHEFERLDDTEHTERTRLRPRSVASRAVAYGIFPGAVVVRGMDWRWGDQDGGPGCQGKVESIGGWSEVTFRSVANIVWSNSRWTNVYCRGHNGKVDLRCITASSGGNYFPQHLPILGCPYTPPAVDELCAGDGVCVELDPGVFKVTQEEHGGWEDYMAEYIGRNGVLYSIRDDGDAIVRYGNNQIFQLNRQCLTKVEFARFAYGDVVRISEDMASVSQLQLGHGEWAGDMALSLGQVGRVLKMRANGDVRVAVNGSRWVFNPKCLTAAPGETPIEEIRGEMGAVDLAVRLQLLSLSEAGSSDVVATASAVGDLNTLKRYLEKHPNEVNAMSEGSAALHVAVVEGYLPIVRLLIKFQADVDIEDEDRDRPLHLCAYVNNALIAQTLVDAGANVNARGKEGQSALAIAASAGHMEVLNVFLKQPTIDLNSQDNDGSTALHRAVRSHKVAALSALLEAGADPSLCNSRQLTPIHLAAKIGYLPAVEELLKWHPKLAGLGNDDGFTPLHFAALVGYADITSMLASHPNCDIDAQDEIDLTALHLALYEGHTKIVERLVGYGANLNSTTPDGNTPLHVALVRNRLAQPSQDTPEILKVKQDLDIKFGMNTLATNVVVAIFLVQEGAKVHIKNKVGLHPLRPCPQDVAELIISYAADLTFDSPAKFPFHGQLRHTQSPFHDLPLRTSKKPLVSTKKAVLWLGPVGQQPVSAAAPISLASSIDTGAERVPAKKSINLACSADTGAERVPAKKSINLVSNTNASVGRSRYEKDINPYAKAPRASALAAAESARSGTSDPTFELCHLCEENPASILFQPCHHLILCSECGVRARKCLLTECRADVKSRIEMCPLCRKNQPSASHPTCLRKHRLCTGCLRSPTCLLCRAIAQQHDQ